MERQRPSGEDIVRTGGPRRAQRFAEGETVDVILRPEHLEAMSGPVDGAPLSRCCSRTSSSSALICSFTAG